MNPFIPKSINSFQLSVPLKTSEHFRVNFEHCGFCGSYDHSIFCMGGCGVVIIHDKDSFSLGHRCLACNVEDGKGQ